MPETLRSELVVSHETIGRLGEPLFESEMTKISIPEATSKLVSVKRAVRLAKKAARRHKAFSPPIRNSVYSLRRVYWPYWMGAIQTEKSRPLFGPRRITFYTIGDAVAGGHAVAKAMPHFVEHIVPQHMLIPYDQGVETFQQELVKVQEEKIPKLFIFGPPVQQIESVQLIYCPCWKVSFFSKDTQVLQRVVHVNGFNGSVRDC